MSSWPIHFGVSHRGAQREACPVCVGGFVACAWCVCGERHSGARGLTGFADAFAEFFNDDGRRDGVAFAFAVDCQAGGLAVALSYRDGVIVTRPDKFRYFLERHADPGRYDKFFLAFACSVADILVDAGPEYLAARDDDK